jgi:hypothetical protein
LGTVVLLTERGAIVGRSTVSAAGLVFLATRLNTASEQREVATTMITSVLVPLDGSELAEQVIPFADRIAVAPA